MKLVWALRSLLFVLWMAATVVPWAPAWGNIIIVVHTE